MAPRSEEAVASWIGERSRAAALEAFHGIRIPVAPVNDLAALLADPHVRARASVTTLEDPAMGALSVVAPSPRLSDTPGAHRHTGRAVGADNEEVFADWLGLAPEEVATLAERGAL